MVHVVLQQISFINYDVQVTLEFGKTDAGGSHYQLAEVVLRCT